MFKGIKKNLLVFVAVILAMGTVLAACGSDDKEGLADDQIFRFNISTEPPALDPGIAQDSTSFSVLTGIFEGLYRLDEAGVAQPALADKTEVSEDGKTYTFTLKDAKWSNGDPVTAHDFEYAWKRALDPALASPYSYQLYYIKGAAEYNAGENTDPNSVAVKALDDKTLQVELNSATPYFTSLTAFFTYYPVHKASVEANDAWAGEASTMVTNGAFLLSEWKHNDRIVLKKNPDYYAADEVKFEEVQMTMVIDSSTELQMYDTDQLDWNGTPNGTVPLDLIPKLRDEGKLNIKGKASVYYYNINASEPPFTNVKVRKALAMAINRQDIVEKVTMGGQMPAYGYVTPGITGEKEDFRTEHPDTDYFKEDAAEAKKLWEEGLAEEGMSDFNSFTLLYNTDDGHKKIAQAIADMWKTNLGIDVTLENQEWAVFLETRQSLNYQVARAGWGADYNDPMTYLDMWTSTSGNNDSGWKSEEYDALIAKAYATSDTKERMDAMAEAEKMLIDNMVVLPIYYYTSIWQQKDYVKNVVIDYAGNIDYTRGYIEN